MTGVRNPAKVALQAAWQRANGRPDVSERLERMLTAANRLRMMWRGPRATRYR